MRCPKCGKEEEKEKGFIKVKVESSDSTWDDWDQIITYRCKTCGEEFEIVW